MWVLDLARSVYEEVLSVEERDRADAFRFGRHRRRYVAAHAQLRELLAAYIDGEPDALVLAEGTNGKPELEGHELRFNLAHSESVGVCAVTTSEVGVDVEAVERERRPEWDGVAARFFHPEELAVLREVAREEAWLEFLRLWTLKEACLKAISLGLLTDPRSFSVARVRTGATREVELGDRTWRCTELELGAEAVVAVAVESSRP